jgi:hypothetical protein
MKKFVYLILGSMAITSLIGCDGGADADSAGGGRGGVQNGFLNLSVTDAPIDGASAVWIQFDGIELKPESGPSITVNFDKPMKVNLLSLQGVNSAQMLFNETLPSGDYNWVRLLVTAADDGVLDSYIVLNDGAMHDLDIPSGDETGLKITGGLSITPNTSTNMTIDFDLRKSITMTGMGAYKLSPALKLIKDKDAGSIVGSVDVDALCPDLIGNGVYLFDGFDVTPDDVDNNDPEPVASAIVSLNISTGTYDYSFGFIPFGQYTAAFTCEADKDDPITDDATVVFISTTNVELTSLASQSTTPFR